jgi:hypothetical protein
MRQAENPARCDGDLAPVKVVTVNFEQGEFLDPLGPIGSQRIARAIPLRVTGLKRHPFTWSLCSCLLSNRPKLIVPSFPVSGSREIFAPILARGLPAREWPS